MLQKVLLYQKNGLLAQRPISLWPIDIDFVKGELSVAGRKVQQSYPLPKEILAILSMGGLIPFLKKYPDWKFA